MRTEYLDYFTKVVEIGTISAAAELLYISPQGLSQAIQQLEKEFGVELFYRKGGKLHLTAAGSDAYTLAQDILISSNALQRRMGDFQEKRGELEADELFLCTAPLPALTFLPAVIRKFHRRNPRTSVHLRELPLPELVKRAKRNDRVNEILLFNMEELEFDEVFRDHPLLFDIHTLVRYPMMACMSSQSALCEKTSIGAAELCSHPLVLFNFSQKTLHRLVPTDFRANILMAGNSLVMSRTLLETDAETIGFSTFLDDLYFKNPNLVSRPLSPSVDLVMGYIETAPELTTPAVRDFLKILEASVPSPESSD